MKVVVENEKYGKIEYSESFWTGAKQISINGTKLEKKDRKNFSYQTESGMENVYVAGNFLYGSVMTIQGENIQLSPKIQWYESIFPILMILFTLIWGSSKSLCAIFPVVGGFVGGLISAIFACCCIIFTKQVKSPLYKLLIGLGIFVLNFLVCFGVAELILLGSKA